MPKLHEPGFFTGNPKAPMLAQMHTFAAPTTDLALRLGGKLRVQIKFDLLAFARTVAKIGYSFAVGELGPENFAPFTRDFILGKPSEVSAGGIVGQSARFPFPIAPRADEKHHIHLSIVPFDGAHIVLAGIRFFSDPSPHVYVTVVGRLTPTRSLLKWPGLTRLTPYELRRLLEPYGIDPDPQL
jgi:hypothetical protein